MNSIKILFLGAGKRLSLLECFKRAAGAEKVHLEMWAIEGFLNVPISIIASILIGPKFKTLEFEYFLIETIQKLNIDLVIPNMDAATVVLAKLKEKIASLGSRAVVSNHSLCAAMEDKVVAQHWFVENDIPVPVGDGFPKIVKHRFGFGSRDQFIIYNEKELQDFFKDRNFEDYLIQPFIGGQEYTVDAYIDRSGRLLAALTRKRIEVSDGEVNFSETHRHVHMLKLTELVLSVRGWEGPITLQFIDSSLGPVTIEVNPRFGGGVTHSIHCGLDMPRWIIREHLGLPVDPVLTWPEGSIMTRCRRDIFL